MPDLTWRRIHESPQMTPITIARPTIVRTRLAPPVLTVGVPVLDDFRLIAVCSPAPVLCAPAAKAAHGRASRHKPSAAAAVAAARESGVSFIIEVDSEEESSPVIGWRVRVFRRLLARGGSDEAVHLHTHPPSPVTTRLPLAKQRPFANSSTGAWAS